MVVFLCMAGTFPRHGLSFLAIWQFYVIHPKLDFFTQRHFVNCILCNLGVKEDDSLAVLCVLPPFSTDLRQ